MNFVPTTAPAQPSTGPDVPTFSATTSGVASTSGTSGLPSVPMPSWIPPTSGYASGIAETLAALKAAGIYQDPADIARQVKGEFGDYNVQPPAPSAYQSGLSPWTMLGAALSGYPGSYTQGAMLANQTKLASQKDYDQALRAYQQGRATWQSDLARATAEAQAANRGIVSSFLPYTAYQSRDVLGANERAYTAGLNYFSKEAALSYDYLREANLQQYRQEQVQIRQDSNVIRQHYLELNNALRSQNQQLAQEKWGLLQQSIRMRMQHEQALTARVSKDATTADINKAQSALSAIDRELTSAYHNYEQDAANASDPNDPTVQAEAAHISQLEDQRNAWQKRVDQLSTQPAQPAQPQTQAPPAGALQTGTYQGHRAITDGIHIWDADTHQLLK